MSSCSSESIIFSTVSLILVALFVFSLIYEFESLTTLSLVLYFFIVPIFLDLLFTIIATSQVRKQKQRTHKYQKLSQESILQRYGPKKHIVFSQNYDLTFLGIEKCHPAETEKYSKAMAFAYRKTNRANHATSTHPLRDFVHTCDLISRKDLIEAGVHWSKLLLLNWSLYISIAIEVPFFFLPASIMRWRILNPMLQATQGTVDACLYALNHGWCINMSGGYHHASLNSSGGFCIYPDITIAIHKARKYRGIKKIIIIDLDAHQGNGHERDFIKDENVFIIDAYNPEIYPNDGYARGAIKVHIRVHESWSDAFYLDQVEEQLKKAIIDFEPQLVVYNAGTDCMAGDPLGGLNISPRGIVQRDALVFETCWDHKVPVAMVLSGGYQPQISKVIGESVVNIFELAHERGLLEEKQ